MKKMLILLVVALLAIGVGSALRAQDSDAQQGGTLRAAWSGQWIALDPHTSSAGTSSAVMAQVVESLVDFDDNINLVGELATDWSQSEDGLTWTFTLREGISFSNGEPLNADVVVWNMERILNPETGSGRKANVGGEEAIWQAVDEMTVSVTLPTINAVFPTLFAGIGIVSPTSVVEETGQIVTPIGTGPFVIGEFEGTTSMTLVRNENYWQEGLPYLDSIDIIVIAENAAREAALRGGQVDWMMDVPPQSVGALEGDENIVVQRVARIWRCGTRWPMPSIAPPSARWATSASARRFRARPAPAAPGITNTPPMATRWAGRMWKRRAHSSPRRAIATAISP